LPSIDTKLEPSMQNGAPEPLPGITQAVSLARAAPETTQNKAAAVAAEASLEIM